MMWGRLKSPGNTALDKFQRAWGSIMIVYIILAALSLCIMDRLQRIFWAADLGMEYAGLWVMFQIVFMAVWALIYAALIAFNLLRRKPVYPIVWAGFGLTLLLAYSYFPVLEHMVTACGGWGPFAEALGAGWQNVARILRDAAN